jgi:anti-sigma factor RsiW
MSCKRFERLGPAWAAGDLSPRERARLERHLAGCADCRRQAEALRRATALARQALAEPGELGEAEWTRIRAALPHPARRPSWRWGLVALSAAAAALLLVVGLWFLPGPATDGGADGQLGPPAGEQLAAVDRFEMRFATPDPKVKIVWVFDRNFKL